MGSSLSLVEKYDRGEDISINPYEILGLNETLSTIRDAERSFRRIAMVVHPDKLGRGDVFETVSNCFRAVCKDIKTRESDKTPMELKNASRQYASRTIEKVPVGDLAQSVLRQRGQAGFSQAFQKMFTDVYEPTEASKVDYSEFMKDVHTEIKGVTEANLNTTFEDSLKTKPKDLIVYDDHRIPYVSNTRSVSRSMITVDAPDDFSGKSNDLTFTDLRKAYGEGIRTLAYKEDLARLRKLETFKITDKSMKKYDIQRKKVVSKPSDKVREYYEKVKARRDIKEGERYNKYLADITRNEERMTQIGLLQ